MTINDFFSGIDIENNSNLSANNLSAGEYAKQSLMKRTNAFTHLLDTIQLKQKHSISQKYINMIGILEVDPNSYIKRVSVKINDEQCNQLKECCPGGNGINESGRVCGTLDCSGKGGLCEGTWMRKNCPQTCNIKNDETNQMKIHVTDENMIQVVKSHAMSKIKDINLMSRIAFTDINQAKGYATLLMKDGGGINDAVLNVKYRRENKNSMIINEVINKLNNKNNSINNIQDNNDIAMKLYNNGVRFLEHKEIKFNHRRKIIHIRNNSFDSHYSTKKLYLVIFNINKNINVNNMRSPIKEGFDGTQPVETGYDNGPGWENDEGWLCIDKDSNPLGIPARIDEYGVVQGMSGGGGRQGHYHHACEQPTIPTDMNKIGVICGDSSYSNNTDKSNKGWTDERNAMTVKSLLGWTQDRAEKEGGICAVGAKKLPLMELNTPQPALVPPSGDANGDANGDASGDVYYKKDGVGGWGGTCTCPSGEIYNVGDNNDFCASLACNGGVSGKCSSDASPDGAGMAVDCAPPVTPDTKTVNEEEDAIFIDTSKDKELVKNILGSIDDDINASKKISRQHVKFLKLQNKQVKLMNEEVRKKKIQLRELKEDSYTTQTLTKYEEYKMKRMSAKRKIITMLIIGVTSCLILVILQKYTFLKTFVPDAVFSGILSIIILITIYYLAKSILDFSKRSSLNFDEYAWKGLNKIGIDVGVGGGGGSGLGISGIDTLGNTNEITLKFSGDNAGAINESIEKLKKSNNIISEIGTLGNNIHVEVVTGEFENIKNQFSKGVSGIESTFGKGVGDIKNVLKKYDEDEDDQ